MLDTEIARYELIKNIVIMSETKLYVELGAKAFAQINRIAPYVHRAIGVDKLDKWSHLKDPKVEFYHMSTDEFYGEWKEEIDTLFIDANHSYEAVMADFENFFGLVKPNGLIILHDSYPPEEKYRADGWCGGVWKVAWKIRTEWNDHCEIVTIPGSFGVSIIRKADKQLMWGE